MDQPIGAEGVCNNNVNAMRTNSHCGVLPSAPVNALTSTPPSFHFPVQPPTVESLLAGHSLSRFHPYLLPETSTNRLSYGACHSRKMGNHHGKLVVNGETYDSHKVQQMVIQLRNELDFSKVCKHCFIFARNCIDLVLVW